VPVIGAAAAAAFESAVVVESAGKEVKKAETEKELRAASAGWGN